MTNKNTPPAALYGHHRAPISVTLIAHVKERGPIARNGGTLRLLDCQSQHPNKRNFGWDVESDTLG